MVLFMSGLIIGFFMGFVPRNVLVKQKIDMFEAKLDNLIEFLSKK